MATWDVTRFREGEYFIFASPDGLTKEYLGVDQKSSDKQGNHDVVLLPTTANPENPDPRGPTQWIIVEKEVGGEIFYSLQTADKRSIDIADGKVVVLPNRSDTKTLEFMDSGARLRGPIRTSPRTNSLDSIIEFQHSGVWYRAYLPPDHEDYDPLPVRRMADGDSLPTDDEIFTLQSVSGD